MEKAGFFTAWSDRLLSVLRIVVGGLYLQHGTAKLFHVPHIPTFDNVQLMSLIGLAGVLEIVFGSLVLIGLFTRFSAFILSGEMAVAYFMVHASRGTLPILNQGELVALYSWVFLFFAAAGGGPWSIDALRKR
jgi:putative oxidoreductase